MVYTSFIEFYLVNFPLGLFFIVDFIVEKLGGLSVCHFPIHGRLYVPNAAPLCLEEVSSLVRK